MSRADKCTSQMLVPTSHLIIKQLLGIFSSLKKSYLVCKLLKEKRSVRLVEVRECGCDCEFGLIGTRLLKC